MVGKMIPDPVSRPRRLEEVDCCPICNSKPLMTAPLQPEPPFGIKQCSRCNIILLSPRPPVDAMKTYYDEYYEGEAKISDRQKNRSQRHVRRLMQYAGKPGRLLDVGAGDGYFLNAARSAGWQVEGLELSEPRVKHAKEWFNLDLKSDDLMSAPFPKESFDAIGMFQLIEHVHDPKALLKRVHELLRPGGIVMLSTPNVLAYSRKNRDVNSWRIPRHLFFFSPRTLVNCLENSGFTVLRKQLKFFSSLEENLGWQPWPQSGPLSRVTRDLWTPFGLHAVARRG